MATGLITACAAIAAVMLTHRYTLHREKQASERKLTQEQYFISTELVFLLERIEPTESFSIRQYQAVRLGMKAKIQAEHLRRLCSMPAGARLHDQKTAGAALWRLWRKHRKAEVGRLVNAKLFREFAREHQPEAP